MNIKKIDNNIQYWHNKNEIPKSNQLILIDSDQSIHINYEKMYYIGQLYICENYQKLIIIGLDDNNNVLNRLL